MKQRVSMGSGGQAIVITNLEFDDEGFGVNQKAGILPIDGAIDPADMLMKAAKYEWELNGTRSLQGFYSVRKKRLLTEEELEKQMVSAAGRSVTNEVVDDEVATDAVSREVIQETNTSSRINQPALIQR